MFKTITSNHKVFFIVFFSIFLGILLRFYNIEFEDLWFDEMASFYVADPNLSFSESLDRNNITEGTPFLFNFILKFFHEIFGYGPNFARYFSATLSTLSIITLGYLGFIIRNNKAFI